MFATPDLTVILVFRTVLIAALVFAAQPAFAHAFLTHATPGAGSTVSTPPTDLELFFTEGVVPHFSTVEVKSASGQVVKTGALKTQQNGREVIVPVPKLAPGQYTVTWHATAEDTHKTEGHYAFTVGQ